MEEALVVRKCAEESMHAVRVELVVAMASAL